MTERDLATFSVTCLFLVTAIFLGRYVHRAPWWRSFAGQVVAGTMLFFLLTLANLLVHLFFGPPGYYARLTLTTTGLTVMMVLQNVLLSRSRHRKGRRAV